MEPQRIELNEHLIIELLKETNRPGIAGLIEWMKREGFFISPASTKYHGAEPGGLAEHSLAVYNRLTDMCMNLNSIDQPISPSQKPLPVEKENIIIACLLHDLCKVGAYIPNPGGKSPNKWNKAQPQGHATLSIERIKKYIELKEIEEMMIRYHMGVYGLIEAYGEDDWQTGEYHLRGDHSKDDEMTKEQSQLARYGKSLMNAWYHNPICRLIYFCDEICTMESKMDNG